MLRLYVALFVSVIAILVIVPRFVFAQITPTAQVNPPCVQVEGANSPCIPTDVGGFVKEYYGYGLGFIGGLSLLFIMWGGYMILTSRGNPAQLNNGKAYIGYAIVSLLLAIFGYVFVQAITVGVLHVPGFG
jgi:hypothetical protein